MAKLNGVFYYCQTTAAESTMGIKMMSRGGGLAEYSPLGVSDLCGQLHASGMSFLEDTQVSHRDRR